MSGDIDVRGRRVVVIGAAVAGAAAAEVLALEGADVLVSEARPADQLDTLSRLHQLGIDVLAGGHDPSHLDGAKHHLSPEVAVRVSTGRSSS